MIMEYQKIESQESKYFKTVKEMCRFYGISRKTFYKYLKQFNISQSNLECLLPHSRDNPRRIGISLPKNWNSWLWNCERSKTQKGRKSSVWKKHVNNLI